MEVKGNFETLIYFLIIAAIYFLNFFLKRAKKKREASTTPPPRRPTTPPPIKPSLSLPVLKKVKVSHKPLPAYEVPKPSNALSKPRIVRIVEDLPSKKNLVFLSEILRSLD